MEIDSLRTELSTVQYEIELIAAIAVVTRANDLRRATLDYLNAALSYSDPADIDKRRLATRAAVGHLIGAARTDLDIAPDDWGQASQRSLPRWRVQRGAAQGPAARWPTPPAGQPEAR